MPVSPNWLDEYRWPCAAINAGSRRGCLVHHSPVQIDPETLPDDPDLLQQMLRTMLQQQSELHAENDKLRLLIQRLTRHQFGRRSEQLTDEQLQFGSGGCGADDRREPGRAGRGRRGASQAPRRTRCAQPWSAARPPAALRGS